MMRDSISTTYEHWANDDDPQILVKKSLDRFDPQKVGEPHRANVGEGEGSSSEVGGTQLPSRTQSLQTVELHSNVKNTEALNALHVGHQEALRSVHCQADVMRRLRGMT